MQMDRLKQDVEAIWKHLMDDLSKQIFSYRMLYYLTGDLRYINKIIMTLPEGRECEKILSDKSRRKVIFGAGSWGKDILCAFPDVKFECFVDNYKVKCSEECVLPIISFEEYLNNYRDAIVLISSRVYNQQIFLQLIEAGVSADNILNVGKMNDKLSEEQYFDLPELKANSNTCAECFVDAGCLDGKSTIGFSKWCNGRYSKIWAFEPDETSFRFCQEKLECEGIHNCELVSAGLWNESVNINFQAFSNGLSRIADSGATKIRVVKLDDVVLNNDNVTFIKMDIEGAEYNAILGARRIIQEQKPKLAISVYHKPEDIWELAKLILSMNQNYCLYLRHYSVTNYETVLYAL